MLFDRHFFIINFDVRRHTTECTYFKVYSLMSFEKLITIAIKIQNIFIILRISSYFFALYPQSHLQTSTDHYITILQPGHYQNFGPDNSRMFNRISGLSIHTRCLQQPFLLHLSSCDNQNVSNICPTNVSNIGMDGQNSPDQEPLLYISFAGSKISCKWNHGAHIFFSVWFLFA